MRDLVKRGEITVIITHKLKEVAAFADHVTVLRRGGWSAVARPLDSQRRP